MRKVLGISLIFIGLAISSVIVYFVVIKEVNGDPKLLSIKLKGTTPVTVKFGEEYKDEGAEASYDGKDITKDIKVTKNLNLKKIGTYKYEYLIRYKSQKKTTERVVKVVDEEQPVIKLKGKDKYVLAIGRKFEDPGAEAADNYDGDLTEKIEIDNKSLDVNTIGTYKITYTATDSSGNKASVEREVEIRQKGGAYQKIAVLNYHFFYEESEKTICTESICEHMDRFREQLNYLRDNGFYACTMDEFVKWMYGEIDLPEKTVLITVDDGAYGTGKNNGNHLMPTLEQYKINATLFLATGWWDIENYRSPYLELESHTHNIHEEGISGCSYRSKLNCISYDEVLSDLKKSIEILKSSNAFCFPYYEPSSTSLRAVKDAGFKVAFVGGYRKASRNDDKYEIPRYPVQDYTTLDTFKYWVG